MRKSFHLRGCLLFMLTSAAGASAFAQTDVGLSFYAAFSGQTNDSGVTVSLANTSPRLSGCTERGHEHVGVRPHNFSAVLKEGP